MTSLYTHIVIVRSNMHVAIDYCTPSTFKFHTVFRHTHCHIDINKTPYMASVKVRPYVWTSVLTHLLNSCCTYSSICRLISVSIQFILRQSPSTFEKTLHILQEQNLHCETSTFRTNILVILRVCALSLIVCGVIESVCARQQRQKPLLTKKMSKMTKRRHRLQLQ